MGVPVGYDQVSVTKPYYRSTYALVIPQGQGMDQVKTGEDFLKLDPAKLATLRIGIYDRSPASEWLSKHRPDRARRALQDHERRPAAVPRRDHRKRPSRPASSMSPSCGDRSPAISRKESSSPSSRCCRSKSEPGVKFDYQMAMGVRYGEREWKQQVEA